jgi:hypothetical protein
VSISDACLKNKFVFQMYLSGINAHTLYEFMYVCPAGYTVPRFSSDPLQTWRKHSMGHAFYGSCHISWPTLFLSVRISVNLLAGFSG